MDLRGSQRISVDRVDPFGRLSVFDAADDGEPRVCFHVLGVFNG